MAAKNWVITLNNHGVDWYESAQNLIVDNPGIKYIVGQFEVGDSGTPHFQGYVQFVKKQRASYVQRVFPGAWHKKADGGANECRHYALKPHSHPECQCKHCVKARKLPFWGRNPDYDDNVELGEMTVNTGSEDLFKEIQDRIDDGATDKELATEFRGMWFRYHKAMKEYRLLGSARERTWMTKTIVLHGLPGTGKTRRALEIAGPNAFWVTYGTNTSAPQYYDGYDGQKVVVFDEFMGQIRRQEMCKLCDEYPCNVPVRGGCVPWLPEVIIITSNSRPEDWWRNIGLGPMQRRIQAPRGSVEEMNVVYRQDLEADNEDLTQVYHPDQQAQDYMSLCAMCGEMTMDCSCDPELYFGRVPRGDGGEGPA